MDVCNLYNVSASPSEPRGDGPRAYSTVAAGRTWKHVGGDFKGPNPLSSKNTIRLNPFKTNHSIIHFFSFFPKSGSRTIFASASPGKSGPHRPQIRHPYTSSTSSSASLFQSTGLNMGNDGGTIARGQDLHAVYNKNAPTQNHIDNLQHSLLSVCSVSSLPLYAHGHPEAVVSDLHGRLYLKEKVLEILLRKKSRRKNGGGAGVAALPHINGLNDVCDVHLTWTSAGAATCPVTKDTKTPKSTFVYSRNCGCVVSKKLLDEIRAHRKVSDAVADTGVADACPKCSTALQFNYDLVLLNPESDASVEEFNMRNYKHLASELGLGHAKKPLKREKSRVKAARKSKENGKISKP